MQSNVIFIPAIKDKKRETRSGPYKYSIESWRNWADKNNCDLVLFDTPVCDINQMTITWQRYYVLEILKNSNIKYNQVLLVDADTIVHPECPNFFELTEGKFSAVHNEGSYDWVLRSIENYHKHLFNYNKVPFNFWEYINTGFMIFNDSHREFINKFLQFYHDNKERIVELQNTFHVGTCQPVINYFLRINDIDVKLLPYEFNMVDLVRKEILDEELTMTKLGWVYHYNAIPDNKDASKTYYWMKKTYEYLYGKLDD